MRRLRKLLALLAGWLIALPAFADTLTIPYSFTAGETITAAKFNSNFSAITTVVNGNLDDNNIKVGASIATSKLNLTAEMPVLRSAGNRCLSAGVTGDTVPRVSLTSSGPITFGAGSASAHDMMLKREDANTLAVRNAGDSAYKDFKAGAGTFSGALTADSLTLTTPYAAVTKFATSAKSANFTANDNSCTHYLITASSAIGVTLPASPADGTIYKFTRVSGSGLITFTPNGVETIRTGDTTDTTLIFDGGSLELTAVSGGWIVT